MRRIDIHRVYKVVRGFVILVSLIPLTYGLLDTYDLLKPVKFNYEEAYKTGYTKKEVDTYLNDKRENKEISLQNNLIVGVGLPTFFFSGKALFDYIAPVSKNIKKDRK